MNHYQRNGFKRVNKVDGGTLVILLNEKKPVTARTKNINRCVERMV